MKTPPNYRALSLFLAVSEEGSLSAAAERLSLSQPSMSQQIAKLEEQLQQKLFHRGGGRSLNLTPAGIALKKNIQGAYNNIDFAWSEVLSSTGAGDSLVVASVHPLFTYFLPKVLISYLHEYPTTRPDIRARSSSDITLLAHTHSIDLGIIYGTQFIDQDLQRVPLFTEEIVAVFKPGTQLEDDLLNLRCISTNVPVITFQKGYALRSMLDRVIRDAPLKVIAEVDNVHLMLSLVRAGIGIAFLPRRFVSPNALETGLDWLRLEYPNFTQSVVAVYKQDERLRPLAQAFLTCCQSVGNVFDITNAEN